MPRSSRSKTKHAQEMLPSSQKLDKIDSWLQKMLDTFPSKGQITASEVEDWHRDLNPFSLEAIDYAFECHRRNAIFFPLYSQILDLCISYEPPQIQSGPVCDSICRARHGKGYGWRDMLWLMIHCEVPAAMGSKQRPHKITQEEIYAKLAIVDVKRASGAPEWRREG